MANLLLPTGAPATLADVLDALHRAWHEAHDPVLTRIEDERDRAFDRYYADIERAARARAVMDGET